MLAFYIASRTLAQGLNRAISACSSIMHDYLDKNVNADKCAQYDDDIGIATNDIEQHLTLRTTFKCIQNAAVRM